MSFKIKLEVFEGPLDLLLYLVKREDVEIFDIPIAKITEQYLEYLGILKLLELNIASEYLVVASQLLQIKSRKLLPQEEPQEAEEEIDLKEELIRKLQEYSRFKEVAKQLREKEIQRSLFFKRQRLKEKEEMYFEANLFDLISAFSKALKEVRKEEFLEVMEDEFTVQDKIHEIIHLLLAQSKVRLNELFQRAKNRLEIVAIFLAILELIRLKEIFARQRSLFGEIEIIRNTERIYAPLPTENR